MVKQRVDYKNGWEFCLCPVPLNRLEKVIGKNDALARGTTVGKYTDN